MKVRGAKGLLILFVIAAVVCGGVLVVFPKDSNAAAAGVKYNVEILNTATAWDTTNPTVNNESPHVYLSSVNKGDPSEVVVAYEGITFQMVVGTKAVTEKLKTGKASYYPVTIIAKTFKAPGEWYQFKSGDTVYDLKIVTTMDKDAVGKLYTTSGGDVDVSTVQAAMPKTKIGDGTADPAGSMIIPISLSRLHTLASPRMNINKDVKATATWTTGQSSILVKGSKSGLEGKALPKDDSTGLLPNPLVGVPVDLAAGTGTLVSTDVSLKVANAIGSADILRGGMWVMKITKQ